VGIFVGVGLSCDGIGREAGVNEGIMGAGGELGLTEGITCPACETIGEDLEKGEDMDVVGITPLGMGGEFGAE
jgi:hypothetical protein